MTKGEFDISEDIKYIGMPTDHGFVCASPVCSGNLKAEWCQHIERYIKSGADAEMLHADQHIIVPIFPSAGVFAEVWIGVDIGNGSGLMSMNFTPDIGRPYSVPLGFWNPGEGMASIRSVILDYIRSRVHPDESFAQGLQIKTKCPATLHGMKASRIMSERSARDQRWKWQCLWNIVMEKACTPCIEESAGDGGNNFGIDDSVAANKKPWQS